MSTSYHIAVILHVLAAVVWVGGVLFMGMAALPAAKQFGAETRSAITSVLGHRFRTLGWGALAMLVATGIWMLVEWGATWSSVLTLEFFESGRRRLLGYKLLCVILMLVISGIHDWYIGPKASDAEVGSPEKEVFRKRAGWLGRVTGILVLVITILAIFVARPWMVS